MSNNEFDGLLPPDINSLTPADIVDLHGFVLDTAYKAAVKLYKFAEADLEIRKGNISPDILNERFISMRAALVLDETVEYVLLTIGEENLLPEIRKKSFNLVKERNLAK